MDLVQQDFKNLTVDSEAIKELQEQSKKNAEHLFKERAKVVDKTISQLLLKTEYDIKDLRAFHFVDGREYIVAPNGIGYRINVIYGPEDDFKVTIQAVPIVMNKELKVLYEGSK